MAVNAIRLGIDLAIGGIATGNSSSLPFFYGATTDPTDDNAMTLQRVGVGTPTATHADPVYQPDYEGQYRSHAVNEPVWHGGRQVTNLLTYSEDFSNADWVKSGTATVTGTNTVNLPAVNDAAIQNAGNGTAVLGDPMIGSIVVSGSGTVNLRLTDYTGETVLQVTLTTTPTRYTVSRTQTGVSTAVGWGVKKVAGDTATSVTVTDAQLENAIGRTDTTTPSEVVSTTTAAVTKTYSTENGNAVRSNVVYTDGEYVTNGDFTDWTTDNPDGWSLSAEDASNYVTEVANGASLTVASGGWSFYQDGAVSGDSYEYSFTLDSVSGSKITYSVGGVNIGDYDAVGTYTGVVTATNTRFFQGTTWSGSATHVISNVSVKRINSGNAINTELVTNGGTYDNAGGYAFTGTGDYYGRFNGVSGDYVSTPDSAAASITSDIDIRVKASADDWDDGNNRSLISKYGSVGQRGYYIDLAGTGAPRFYTSSDGTNVVSSIATAAISATDGDAIWIRVTWSNSGNVVNYYTSTDESTWSQLGDANVAHVDSGIFDGNTQVEVGYRTNGNPWIGNIYQAQVYNGIDGTLAVNFNAADNPDNSATHVASTGETWTWTDIASGTAVDGGFTTSSTPWYGNNANSKAQVVNGVLRLYNSAAQAMRARQTITTIPGRKYRLKTNLDYTNNANIDVGTTEGGTDLLSEVPTDAADAQYTFIAEGASTYLSLRSSSVTQGEYFDVEYIQVAQDAPALAYNPAAENLITDSYDLSGWTASGTPFGDGNELVTNGDFATDSDWTKNTGWSIAAGVASCDGTQTGNSSLQQSNVGSVNNIYRLTFTLSNYSAGTVTPYMSTDAGTARSANGTYTELFTPTTNGTVYMSANVDFIGDIDDVSVELVSATGITSTPLSATHLTDDDGAGYEFITDTVTVTADIASTTRAWIKKDSDTSRFPIIQSSLSGGTGKICNFWLNTSTGATSVTGADSANGAVSSHQVGDWWVLTMEHTDTGTNTSKETQIYPAGGTVWETTAAAATGSITVGQVEVFDNSSLESVEYAPPIITSGASDTLAETEYDFDINNHSQTQGLWFLEMVNTVDFTNDIAVGSYYNVLGINGSSRNIIAARGTANACYIYDGTTTKIGGVLTWGTDNVHQLAAAFGGSSMILGSDGLYGTVATYDGAFDQTTGITIGESGYPMLFRNIQFYRLNYSAAVTKGLELMK